FWETGPGEEILAPVAVRALRGNQIIDAGANGVALAFAGGEQGEQGPSRLRRGRRALSGERRIIVTAAGLAPTAAGVLHFSQPSDGATHHRILHVETNALQPAQYLPGAVEVIHPPTANPAAAFVLCFPQEIESANDL